MLTPVRHSALGPWLLPAPPNLNQTIPESPSQAGRRNPTRARWVIHHTRGVKCSFIITSVLIAVALVPLQAHNYICTQDAPIWYPTLLNPTAAWPVTKGELLDATPAQITSIIDTLPVILGGRTRKGAVLAYLVVER
ncbi:hypothetical protein BDN72DRAFT_855894 [Pluteus cervinus]|uniref:Uncharacterized protein n=1 Tax=Pluteus cervinus TaxID=181527 RepID=A0ACD3B1V5_9AGAR|nr:hypothetical protein BDN72DRAFT_855894 [Pluteus cervinus]